ncbi:hemerythrin domain-containing protein [Kitasatospora sp. NPDC056076]|uniref:hemerythrin domain-containing protein n=1 Tax=Kitasatospora sp. NPDC056076 TaxID=3345703 RepID=UPI0035DD9B8D
MGSQPDLLDDLLAEHDAIRVRFGELAVLPLGDQRRRRVVDLLTGEIMRHFAAEERYLHPLARESLADAPAEVGIGQAAHRAVEALLADLGYTSAVSPAFDRLVARLVEEAMQHFAAEEAHIYAEIRTSTPAATLAELGRQARRADLPSQLHPWPQPPAAVPPDRRSPERLAAQRIRALLPPGEPG